MEGSKPNVKYFQELGSIFYILVDYEQKRKLDPKSDEEIFLGYSINRRAYCVFNKCIKSMMESPNVIVYDDQPKVISHEEEEESGFTDKNVEPNIPHIIMRTTYSLMKKIEIYIMMRIIVLNQITINKDQ